MCSNSEVPRQKRSNDLQRGDHAKAWSSFICFKITKYEKFKRTLKRLQDYILKLLHSN